MSPRAKKIERRAEREPGALDGVRVLDLSDHPSGMIAARAFADWNADVIRVHPEAGALRGDGRPFRLVPDVGVRNAMTAMLTAGIRVISAAEEIAVQNEITSSDIVLTSSRAHAAAILANNPQAIVASVTEFPAFGRYSDWAGSEMIHQALSGAMFTTGPSDRRPLHGVGHRAYYAAGWTTVIGVMGALLARERIARGQLVEVSVYEACAAMAQNLVSQYAYSGTWPTRERYDGMVTTIRCKDGWLVLFAYLHWSTMCRAFDVMHLVDDPRFTTIEGRSANWEELSRLLQEAAYDLEVDRIVETAQSGKVAASRANTMADILDDPYHRGRLWVQHDEGGERIQTLESGIRLEPLAYRPSDTAPPRPIGVEGHVR